MKKFTFLSIPFGLMFGLMIIFTQPAQATTYYVSTTGSNSYNGTTLATPFNTVAYAISKVVAGDIIYIRSGNYSSTSTISISKAGTSVANITLSVYPDDITAAYPNDGRPVMDFSAMSYGTRGFSLSGANYWKIYGIRIKGAGDNGMNITGSTNNTTIEYCDFYRNRDSGMQIGGGSHDITVINSDSYENADYGTNASGGTGGNADGFSPKLDVGTNIYYRGCRAWRNSDDGWDGYMRPSTGMLAVLENCWTWGNGYYWKDGTTNSNMNGNGFKMGGSDALADGTKVLAHDFRLINCLGIYNKANGFDQNNNAGSIWLYNCTAYQNKKSQFGVGNGSLAVYVAGATEVVTNCVSLTGASNSFRLANATTNATAALLATNNFAATAADFVSVDSTGLSNRRKIDGSLPDIAFMHLKTGSALINAGTILSALAYYGGTGVPYSGTKPDLGCFETIEANSVGQIFNNQNNLSCSPNPAHLIANINFSLVSEGIVDIAVYNLSGSKVAQVINQLCTEGNQSIKFDCSGLKSGVYIVKAQINNESFSSKIMIE
jgi:hypothetical protein